MRAAVTLELADVYSRPVTHCCCLLSLTKFNTALNVMGKANLPDDDDLKCVGHYVNCPL